MEELKGVFDGMKKVIGKELLGPKRTCASPSSHGVDDRRCSRMFLNFNRWCNSCKMKKRLYVEQGSQGFQWMV
jgi:hypothetical protein